MRVETVYDVDPELDDPRARGDGEASLDLGSRGEIAVAAGTWAGVIRSETGEIVRRLDGVGPSRRAVGLCRFLPGGRQIVSYCTGPTAGFHYWDVVDGSEVDCLESPDAGPLEASSPAGSLGLVRTNPATAAVWNLATREIVRWIEVRSATAFAFLDENTLVIARDAAEGHSHVLSLVELDLRRPLLTRLPSPAAAIAAFGSANVCIGGRDGSLRLFRRVERLAAAEEFPLPDLPGFAGAIAARADGAAFAAFGRNLPGWLVRANDGAILAFSTARPVTEARFSADGRRLFAVGERGLLRAWNVDLEDRR